MGRRLDGAPVVPGGEHHGVDAVRDPLVVGDGAVRIELGEARGVDDAARRSGPRGVVAAEVGDRDARRHPRHAAVAEVREDAQAELAARELGHAIAERLGDGVEQVGAHGVAAVHEHVGHEEALAEIAHGDVARPAPALHQPRHRAVGEREQLGPRPAHPLERRVGRGHVVDLDLRRHQRLVHGRLEAARGAHALGGMRGRGDDAGLFDRHGDEVVRAVDLHVERDPERQRQGADGVLDHPVGRLEVEPALAHGVGDGGLVEGGDGGEHAAALDHAQGAEPGDDGGLQKAYRVPGLVGARERSWEISGRIFWTGSEVAREAT